MRKLLAFVLIVAFVATATSQVARPQLTLDKLKIYYAEAVAEMRNQSEYIGTLEARIQQLEAENKALKGQ